MEECGVDGCCEFPDAGQAMVALGVGKNRVGCDVV
jgi:hypothetical protein